MEIACVIDSRLRSPARSGRSGGLRPGRENLPDPVARQRPETARGIVFMLLEDERGTVNLIVPPRVYDRHRSLVRTAPLLRAKGKLERREGTTNVLVSEVRALERTEAKSPPEPPRSPRRERRQLAVAELRTVAPAGHSFGRRGR